MLVYLDEVIEMKLGVGECLTKTRGLCLVFRLYARSRGQDIDIVSEEALQKTSDGNNST